MSKIVLHIITCFGLSSCKNKKTETKVNLHEITTQKVNDRFIRDTSFNKRVNSDISINKKGDIGYKFISKPECNTCSVYEYYVTVASIANKGKKNETEDDYTEVPLKKLIDTGSLQILGNTYFKDKFHAYSLRMSDEGGHVYLIDGADAATFRIYSDSLSYMAYDNNYFYDHDYRLAKEETKGLKRESR